MIGSVSQLPRTSAYLMALGGPKSGHWAAITGQGITLSVITSTSHSQIPAARVHADDSARIIVEPLASNVSILLNDVAVTAPRLLSDADVLTVGTDRYRFGTDREDKALGSTAQQAPADPAAALARANSLVPRREYQQAAQLYELAAAAPGTAADATYGLGVCAVMTGDSTAAAGYFSRSLELAPSRADAHYYLGYIAETQGDPGTAMRKYRDALALDPRHGAAHQQLQGMASRPGEGIYAFLSPNPTPEARQAEALARGLEAHRPARITAHMGYYWPPLALIFLLAAALEFGGIHLIQADILVHLFKPTSNFVGTAGMRFMVLTCILVQAAVILYGAWVVIRASFITFHCFQGRFQIEQGVIFRKITNINLWQLRAIDLKRTVVNTLTGDGALIFVLPHELIPQARLKDAPPKTKIKVIGFDHGTGLLGDGSSKKGCYWEMLTLSTMMRTIPAVKGIIQ